MRFAFRRVSSGRIGALGTLLGIGGALGALPIANTAPPWSAGAGRTGMADFFGVCTSFGVALAFAFGGGPGGRGKLLGNPNRMSASS
jgi:hypothetical protein